jgi:hypothetical protein
MNNQFNTSSSFFTNEAIINALGGNYQMLREAEEIEKKTNKWLEEDGDES